ncbi:MAG: hypothetical protein R3200_06845 [Xanthomonadales bacterium]|nr:hypothetical protein [Xanthomonadales bacterium]
MNQILVDALPELIATLVGVAVGGVIAFTYEHLREKRFRNRQAFLILRSLAREMRENYDIMKEVLPHYERTPYGKSFYLNTSVWETALAVEQLPEVIGFQLADTIANHYSTLTRLRYYGDLLVKVWLTNEEIDGYPQIRAGFRRIIIDSLNYAIENHPSVIDEIDRTLTDVRGKYGSITRSIMAGR